MAGSDYESRQRFKDLEAERQYAELMPKLPKDVQDIISKDPVSYRVKPETTSDKDEPGAMPVLFDDDGNAVPYIKLNHANFDDDESIIREIIANGELHLLTLKSTVDKRIKDFGKQLLKKLMGILITADNLRTKIEVINIAGNLGFRNGLSHSVIATTICGCTRQNFSKMVIAMKEQLGLPADDRESKRSESRKTYRKRNRGNFKF